MREKKMTLSDTGSKVRNKGGDDEDDKAASKSQTEQTIEIQEQMEHLPSLSSRDRQRSRQAGSKHNGISVK